MLDGLRGLPQSAKPLSWNARRLALSLDYSDVQCLVLLERLFLLDFGLFAFCASQLTAWSNSTTASSNCNLPYCLVHVVMQFLMSRPNCHMWTSFLSHLCCIIVVTLQLSCLFQLVFPYILINFLSSLGCLLMFSPFDLHTLTVNAPHCIQPSSHDSNQHVTPSVLETCYISSLFYHSLWLRIFSYCDP